MFMKALVTDLLYDETRKNIIHGLAASSRYLDALCLLVLSRKRRSRYNGFEDALVVEVRSPGRWKPVEI